MQFTTILHICQVLFREICSSPCSGCDSYPVKLGRTAGVNMPLNGSTMALWLEVNNSEG